MKLQVISYKLRVMVCWLLVTYALCVSCCYAYAVSSDELIEKARELDGRTIVYKGEVVTDVLARGSHSWINVNDGSNAIGIWCDTALAGKIKSAGNYRHSGDIVEIEGIFNRACSEHSGELDIHAYRLDVIKEGLQIEENLSPVRARLAAIFFILTAFIIIRYRKRI